MLVKRLLIWVDLLVLISLPSVGQGMVNPKDTSYVMKMLRGAEAIEMRQPEQALHQYQQAFLMAQKIGFTKGYFESIRLIAYLLDMLGRHDESYKLAKQGLQKALQDSTQRYRSLCYFALAQSAKWQGKNKEAILHFKQAAPFIMAQKNPRKIAALYQNLGLVYETEKLYPQALAYFDRALNFDRMAKSPALDIAVDYQSMAAVLVKQKKLIQGLTLYQKSKTLLDPVRDLHVLAQLYGNLANLHKELGHPDSSLYYYRNALRINQQLNNPLQQVHLLAGLAETYNELKNYKRARFLLDKAYAMAKRQQVGLSEFRNIYREYANANLGLGHYKGAIPWYDKYMQTNDSLSTLAAKALLEEYEVKLRQAEAEQKLAQKQQQIRKLEQDRERQNYWVLIAALVGIVVMCGLLFAFFYSRQRQRWAANQLLTAQRTHALAVAKSELQGQQSERLRIAKEMHDDLGASLTAIGLLSEVVKTRMGAMTTPEVEKISTISADMITTMNEIIWSLNTQNDNLNGLIAYIRAYASEFIDNTALCLQTQVHESAQEIVIRGTDRRNIFLTVKEALHNVVKHARAKHVSLMIQPQSGRLLIEVTDDGEGFVPSESTRFRNGLGNMQHRMGESGGSCTIISSPAGTRVAIEYPYTASPVNKILQM